MRYDTDEALRELVVRCARIRQRRERRVAQGLAALSLTCCALLVASAALLVPAEPATVGMVAYGAYLLPGEAGGFVLAAVVAFALGAAVTLLCLRHRRGASQSATDRVLLSEGPVEGGKKEGSHV